MEPDFVIKITAPEDDDYSLIRDWLEEIFYPLIESRSGVNMEYDFVDRVIPLPCPMEV